MLDTADTQDGGVSNLAIGSFTGDGTNLSVTTGFLPRLLVLINMTDKTRYEIVRGMAAGHALKAVAAGTLTDDNSGILLSGADNGLRGFTVPAAININAKAFNYYAFG